jgi:hypothetical protein
LKDPERPTRAGDVIRPGHTHVIDQAHWPFRDPNTRDARRRTRTRTHEARLSCTCGGKNVGLRGVQYGGDLHARRGRWGRADRIEGDQRRHTPHHVSGGFHDFTTGVL